MKLVYLYVFLGALVALVAGSIIARNNHGSVVPTNTPVAVDSVLPSPTPAAVLTKVAYKIVSTPEPVEHIIFRKRAEQSQAVINSFTATTPPSDKFIWYQALARAEIGLKNYQEANTAYALAIQSDPTNPLVPSTNAEWSDLLVLVKDYNNALVLLQKAVTARPDVPDYWEKYISFETTYFKASDSLIQDLYRQAIQKSNNQARLIKDYAIYLEVKADLAGALYQWRFLLNIYPNNTEADINVSRLESLINK